MIFAISMIIITATIVVFMISAQKKFIKGVNEALDVLNKEADAIKQELGCAKFWSDQLHAEVGYGHKSVKEEEDDSIVILTKERDHRIIDSLDKERGY